MFDRSSDRSPYRSRFPRLSLRRGPGALGSSWPLLVLMAGLLVGLGWLQWVWTGELAKAEEERHRKFAEQLADDAVAAIDAELARALLAFHPGMDRSARADLTAEAWGEKWREWEDRAPWPTWVRDLWWISVQATPGAPAVARRSTAERPSWDEAQPPADIARSLSRLGARGPRPPGPRAMILPEVPALVVSVRDGRPGRLRSRRPDDGSGSRGQSVFEREPPHRFSLLVVRLDPDAILDGLLPDLQQSRPGAEDFRLGLDLGDGVLRWVGEMVEPGGVVEVERVLLTSAVPLDPGRLLREGWGRRSLVDGLSRFGFGPPGPEREQEAEPRPHEKAWRLVVAVEHGSLGAVVRQQRRRNLGLALVVLALLGGSAVSLVLATRRAQALARQQLDLVAGITHDLRTPIAAISSLADNLQDGVVEGKEGVGRYGATIGREARRLRDLVEQGLTLAGLEAVGGRSSGPVDLQALLEEVREIVATESDGTLPEVVIRVEDGLVAQGETALLRRALVNLLANACRYGGGAAVELLARRSTRRPGWVELVVADDGPGLAAEERSRLFEPFFRGEAARRTGSPGSGLGLAVVQRVAEVHGGEVEAAADTRSRGATFVLRWPGQPAGETGG